MLFSMSRDALRRSRSGFALALVLLLGAACGSRERREEALEREIAERRAKVEAEIARLGPDHPWAGKYYGGDLLGFNTALLVAPDSGCLALQFGCVGTYGSNWGKVRAEGARLTLLFERSPADDEFWSFDTEYEVVGTGADRVLKPRRSRELLRLER